MKKYEMVGGYIRSERIAKGISIRGLAREIGISDTELSRIENGERKNLQIEPIIKICEILDIDFVDLLKRTGYLKTGELRAYDVVVEHGNKEYFTRIYAENDNEAFDKADEFIENNLPKGLDDGYGVTISDVDENYDSESCETCEYYCPCCGECTYGED